eukprot:TRINITY_DN1998_c5_g1_i1.p1 TRINITY_DN1998_c5_g1~~TRINITY_DN1998_c5_g1_i1.p1  ORF type:complete len:468 (+),score=128.24 TRINITY_DN1998_c5_g1_i1:66-1406(+)
MSLLRDMYKGRLPHSSLSAPPTHLTPDAQNTTPPSASPPPSSSSSSSSSSMCAPSQEQIAAYAAATLSITEQTQALSINEAPLCKGSLTWDMFFDEQRDVEASCGNTFRVYIAGKKGPLFIMIHGAGHSAMSFALVAKFLKVSCRVVSFDLRAHGNTRTLDEDDLSKDTQISDITSVINKVVPKEWGKACVVGHSMGGALAVHLSHTNALECGISSIAVLDVVEGTAIAALPSMHSILANRPKAFINLDHAISWSLGSGSGTRNRESAEIAVPEQLIVAPDGTLRWRTNLAKSEKHWRGWFEGMSKLFLSAPCGKLLMIAGNDRLDKELLIAQMMGKFQIKFFSHCGHQLHEDEPKSVALALAEFALRNLTSVSPAFSPSVMTLGLSPAPSTSPSHSPSSPPSIKAPLALASSSFPELSPVSPAAMHFTPSPDQHDTHPNNDHVMK